MPTILYCNDLKLPGYDHMMCLWYTWNSQLLISRQTDRQTDTQPSKPFQITSASTSTLAWCMCICFVCKFAFHSF